VSLRILGAALFLALTGCTPTPESYPIPEQHQPAVGPEKLATDDYVNAGDPWAEQFFVRDIRGSEGKFRWTSANPELQFLLKKTERLKFQLVYGVNKFLLDQVGPLEMTIAINGHELAIVRDPSAGDKTFQKPVPAEWLNANAKNVVSIRVHHPWLTPDKTYLGFIFIAAGFVE
jgi:hypothetical protein